MDNKSVTLEKRPLLVISYQGKKEDNNFRSFKKGMTKMLTNNVKQQIAFTGTKASTSFQIKDKIRIKHNHVIAYYNESPEAQCNETTLVKSE